MRRIYGATSGGACFMLFANEEEFARFARQTQLSLVQVEHATSDDLERIRALCEVEPEQEDTYDEGSHKAPFILHMEVFRGANTNTYLRIFVVRPNGDIDRVEVELGEVYGAIADFDAKEVDWSEA